MRRFTMHGVVLSMVLLTGFVGSARGEAFIVKNGEPQAQIVITEEAVPLVKLAAEDLQAHIQKISGAELPITSAPDADVPVNIYVGQSRYTDELKITDDGLKDGAYKIVSGPNWLVLLGCDDRHLPPEPYSRSRADGERVQREWDQITGDQFGCPNLGFKNHNNAFDIWDSDEAGSFNAVAEFLRSLGVRWFLPDPLGEVIPEMATIELPKVNKTVRPDFAQRWPYMYGTRFFQVTPDELRWLLRMGISVHAQDRMYGVMAHGLINVHRRPEVMKAYPEMFAIFGNERQNVERYGKPCLSSERLFNQTVKYVRAVFDHLDEPMVSIMPSDGYAMLCQCELCEGKDTMERGRDGMLSDYVWGFVNRVAREVYKTHPDKKVHCCAYGAYSLPPLKIGKLSPNVVVGMCQARRDFFDLKKRAEELALRKAWRDKMPEPRNPFTIYEYYMHAKGGMPVFFPHQIAEDLKSLKGISLGEFIDFYKTPRNEDGGLRSLAVDHLNLYVTMRCYWNADLDVDALLVDYYKAFYGPAAEAMQDYIEYAEANWMKLRKEPKRIPVLFDLIETAAKKVPPDSIYGRRIAWIADYMEPLRELPGKLAAGRDKSKVLRIGIPERDAASVTIDGKLDEVVWATASGHPFKELATGGKPKSATTVRAFWSGESLYMGIRCEDDDTDNLAIATDKDGDLNIHFGDCVELLVETQNHSYYQLAVNPTGAMLDLDREGGIIHLWKSRAEADAFVGDGFWSVELRLPAAGAMAEDLDPMDGVAGTKPTEADSWYVNVCRQRKRGDKMEYSALSPTGKEAFHELLKFVRLAVE